MSSGPLIRLARALSRLVTLVLTLAFLAGPALPGRAGDLPGADAADFQVALRAWLADNDATALPAFAELAAQGNAAARLLLALIDRMPETHGDWLAERTPDRRRALMRSPDGRSWMTEAAEEAEIARLWLDLWDAGTDPETAFAFVDEGEARAARLVLLAHAARERSSFARLAEDDRYPQELLWLALNEAGDDAAARAESLHPGDPQRRLSGAPAPGEEALDAWLDEAVLAEPLRLFCADACGEDAGSCRRAAFAALGGYRGLLSLGPPSETLVPRDAWFASPKGAQTIPRRIAILRPRDVADECLARFIVR